MEPEMLDQKNWTGALGLALGSQLYIDFTKDPINEAKVEELVQAIRTRMPK